MKYIFARHGESTSNTEKVISNRDDIHGLTETGIHQAEVLAQRLADENILRIYSSPLLRAKQTSRIVADALGIPMVIAEELREFDCGTLEGQRGETAWASFIGLFQDWLRGEHREVAMGGGESFQDISDRFMPFMQGLIKSFTNQDGCLLLVSHGGVFYTMLPLLLENITFEFSSRWTMTNTSIVIADEKDGHMLCREWCGEVLPISD